MRDRLDSPRLAVGIDLGGTQLKAVLVDASGAVLARELRPSQGLDAKALVATVRDLVRVLCVSRTESSVLGICSPGLPDATGRFIEWLPRYKLPIEGIVWSEALDRPDVPVINDANAALIGEAWIGAARDKRNVAMLTLGTGVGGAMMIDGKLVRGATGRAGHLGHLSICDDTHRSICNTPGSLEDAIGNASVGRRSNGRFNMTRDLIDAVRKGDIDAIAVWQRSIDALARGIVSIINAFDPELIVIGGGIANVGDTLFVPLERAVRAVEWSPRGERVAIRQASLGEWSGAVGAAARAFQDEA